MPDIKPMLAAALLLLAGARAQAQQTTIRLTSADGCALEAFYLAPSSGAYIFINTHGLGSSKNEWAPFQEELKKAGYGYLSLDLRGHNESRTCGGLKTDYRNFSKADWNNASRDIAAAAAWLAKKGFSSRKLVFCGASIGANLSLKAAAESRRKPAAVILLSPGLEYAGVNIKDYFLAPRSYPVLTTASDDDPYASQSSSLFIRTARAGSLRPDFIDGKGGHGVSMLNNPDVLPAVLAWVKSKAVKRR
ncbi:MAG: hypothetical protein A2081_00940 [Elusimicrobia bacterium GWC2_61_19]|nr:MAG: hypothetical protein A2081_00940 [Elusimicrobia bacterium GWC2_61_19]HBB67827.1 hypothetical protein [Elusimicrobiota bacterium]